MTRTSLNAPLMISEVQRGAGALGMSICPGKVGPSHFGPAWARDLTVDLDLVAAWGASAVVTLMEKGELADLKVSNIGEEIEGRGLEWHHLPVPDLGVPGQTFEHLWAWHGLRLRARLVRGERIFVHCRGGLGRTGLLVARLLIELGDTPPAAIARVRSARPGAIETPAQEAYARSLIALDHDEQSRSRILGCLMGGAVGDGFGYMIEFDRLSQIKERFGERGMTIAQFDADQLVVSDDTQMTLFTAFAITESGASKSERLGATRLAYMDWLRTQQGHWSAGACGLLRYRPLWRRRAPGVTCMSALVAGGHGLITRPINNSKGCGGVMRVAPIGLLADLVPAEAFKLGADAASITHGHPSGYLSAGALCFMIGRLTRGEDLAVSLAGTLQCLTEWEGSEEVQSFLKAAIDLSRDPAIDPVDDVCRLGEGWVGEEALAIAVYAVLRATTFEEVVSISANHDGDSDSTASIAGQIWGAIHGAEHIPHAWVRRLDVFEPLCEAARRLAF